MRVRIGDIVKYYGSWTDIGVVLKVNDEGGTIKVYRTSEGNIQWWVTSGCEVVSESR